MESAVENGCMTAGRPATSADCSGDEVARRRHSSDSDATATDDANDAQSRDVTSGAARRRCISAPAAEATPVTPGAPHRSMGEVVRHLREMTANRPSSTPDFPIHASASTSTEALELRRPMSSPGTPTSASARDSIVIDERLTSGSSPVVGSTCTAGAADDPPKLVPLTAGDEDSKTAAGTAASGQRLQVHWSQGRKRRASGDSHESVTQSVETSASDVRDDDEDDEDDEDDAKLQSSGADPDRLKAFNLFVRLFVDENLDRMVPISKQPKEKVQAILEACNRQFVEFHERARKRIRTYLKSCRRMRRCRDSNGVEQMRPTPPHLTSAMAETILAQACENESNNAKRMRMGLEPLPAHNISSVSTFTSSTTLITGLGPLSSTGRSRPGQVDFTPLPLAPPLQTSTGFSPSATPLYLPTKLEPGSLLVDDVMRGISTTAGIARRHQVSTALATSQEIQTAALLAPLLNGAGYGTLLSGTSVVPGYPAHHRPAPPTPSITYGLSASSSGAPGRNLHNSLQNGPTDLSVKKTGHQSQTQGLCSQLNAVEVATVRQLIAGYRESAAFLYRSADELEQLLLHQQH